MSQVSCIIPFYNGGDSIARAIDSVIYDPLCAEVVVVVDGSPQPLHPHLTPAQLKLIDQGKLRVVELATNHGQGSARNIGASLSIAPYLSFLDQDDVYLRGFYEPVVAALVRNPGAAAIEVSAEIVQDGRIVLDSPDPRYFGAIHSAPWNVVIRRGAFWACGAFPVGPEFRTEIAGEDLVFKTALKRSFLVLRSPVKLIRHNIREGSATDKYLKRTSVVDNEIVFHQVSEYEAGGTAHRAAAAHVARALASLEALKLVAPADPPRT